MTEFHYILELSRLQVIHIKINLTNQSNVKKLLFQKVKLPLIHRKYFD